jgi:hypothetical protein
MNSLDIAVMIMAPSVLCFSAFPILERLPQFKKLNINDKILASVLVSLVMILFPLYIVGIIVGNFFVETSKILFLIGNILICFKVAPIIFNRSRRICELKSLLKTNTSLINLVFIVSIAFFTIKYTFWLLIKAVIDWDVAAVYLPLSRAICEQNLIPLTDQGLSIYSPQGISVLYAWVYANSSSLLTENFRLIPLVFALITMLLVYNITKLFLNENVTKLAVIVYTFMPIFDNSLVWFSFYPDIAFAMLTTAIFYFLFKYIKTNETVFGVLAGSAFGLSSFMKLQSFWLFPVIIFTVLPFFRKKGIRLFIPILAPFVILLGILPISFLRGTLILEVFWSLLLSTFRFDKFWYIFSLIFLALLVIVANELGVKAFASKPRPSPFKTLFLVWGISLPFHLIWYLRNYFLLGTFTWVVSIKDPNFQWALEILRTTPTASPTGEFYLSSLLFPLILPALGTAFLLPKLVGIKRLICTNRESSSLYTWAIGYFLIYFLFTDIINERYLLPIAPFMAIFSAVGIFFIVGYLTKSRDINVMVLISMFLGIFSLVQSLLIFRFSRGYSDLFVVFCLKIADLLNVPGGILSGAWLSVTNLGMQCLSLLYFGFIVSLVAVLLLLFVSARNVNIAFHVYARSIPVKRCLYFSLVLLVALSVLVVPYFSLAYRFSDGDVTAFKDRERLMYGFDTLYSEVLPYLSANTNDGDAVVSAGTIPTGLQYYLKDIKIIDISFAGNLGALRNIIESTILSETFSALQTLKVRYVLVPNDVLHKMPSISGFLNPILTSKDVELPTGYRLFFKKVISGGWELYELQLSVQTRGSGPTVTIFQDNVLTSKITQYFYYDVSNVTVYLNLSGHSKYNITGFPAYFSFEKIIPSPSSISVDANQWINFTGLSDINYTIYWSNTNWRYQHVG